MASLTELTQWEASIYQLETTDPVKGGNDGISNLQAKQLANRTAYLKQQVELKAPVASPTFTGMPAVPTAAADTSTTQVASTAFVVGQAATVVPVVDGVAAVGTSKKFARQDHVHPTDTTRAPVASPTFTGVPAVPTAEAGTNTTQIANTAFVATAIANLIASSPAALDTLNELAAALGNDPNFSTTMINALADKVSISDLQKGAYNFSTDNGIANAYVVNLTPALTSRTEGQVIMFKVANANSGASTLNDGIGPVQLVGGAHSALQGGEMTSGGVALAQWNSTVGTGSYVLLFCTGAPMQVPLGTKSNHAVNKSQLDAIKSSLYVEVSLAGGVMTWTLPKQVLKFRNPVLTTGAPVEVTPAADLTLTFPVGASVGSLSAILANLVPVVFYNGGSPVLGVQNLSGGVDLSEAGLLSATAISASATSASITYASTTVSNSPYITAGIVQSTQATAGTWATAPNIIPKDANLSKMIGGVGFSYPQDVLASRAVSTTYYNTSGVPKPVNVSASSSASATTGATMSLTITKPGGSPVVASFDLQGGTATGFTKGCNVYGVVPPGGAYQVTITGSLSTITNWTEG